jgi:hypothetical protein
LEIAMENIRNIIGNIGKYLYSEQLWEACRNIRPTGQWMDFSIL